MAENFAATKLSASQLARATDVSTDTLRYYERKALIALPPRAPNGYRCYPAEAVGRVQLIRRALAIGFSVEELRRVLRSRDQGGVPCRQVRQLAAQKIEQVEERLRELQALRNSLRATLKQWDARLARTPAGKRAGLLESLDPGDRNGGKRSAAFSTNSKRKETKR